MPCLEITTMVGCPLMCTFCPQDKLKANYGKNEKYLSLENFKTVLDKVPKHVRIDFSGMSEPWANPQATEMIAETLARGFHISIYTTLVGLKYTEVFEVNGSLIAHKNQVEALVVHLPDDAGNMRGFKMTDEYRNVLRIFMRLKRHLRYFDMMTMSDNTKPHPALRLMDQKEWTPLSRAGNLNRDDIGEQKIEDKLGIFTPVSCSFTPFYDHNVLLPNGDVVLCCMDYSLKHKVGNLFEHDYYDIFSSEGMSLLHAENTKRGFSDKTLCKSCSRAKTYELSDSHQFWDPVNKEQDHGTP